MKFTLFSYFRIMKKLITVLAVSLIVLFVWQTMWQANALSQTPAWSDFYYVGDSLECQKIKYRCEDGWQGFSDDAGCGCKKTNDPDVICTMEYAPICGMPYFECPEGAVCSAPMPVTYSNKCHLEAANATVLYKWVCEQDKPKACPENWDPVCGKTQQKACLSLDCASHEKTYSNMCFLESEKSEFLYEGECKEEKKELPKPTDRKYYIWDTLQCHVIDYMCEDGWQGFSDDIGCGCETEKDTLSDDAKKRLDTVIANFIEKLENKWYSDEKIRDMILLVSLQLGQLKNEKPEYRDLIDYVLYVLRQYDEKYKENNLKIIEDIFKAY